jgi:hypothetical protein
MSAKSTSMLLLRLTCSCLETPSAGEEGSARVTNQAAVQTRSGASATNPDLAVQARRRLFERDKLRAAGDLALAADRALVRDWQSLSPQHHSPAGFRYPPRLIQESWARACEACATIQMSTIPTSVILPESWYALIAIECLRPCAGGPAHVSLKPM